MNLVQRVIKWYESGKIIWLCRPVSMTCPLESLRKGLNGSRHIEVSRLLVEVRKDL